MKIGLLIEPEIDQIKSTIRSFSAYAIKAGQGKHSYEITSSSSSSYDYLVKFKKDILIINANRFVEIFERSIKGAKIENDEIVVIPKFTVTSPISFDDQIVETYKIYNGENFQDWISNHLNTDKVFWAYNSEKFIDTDKSFDLVVCVASGLIPLYLASNLREPGCIYITDINQNCLDFQESLIHNLENIQNLDHYRLFVNEFAESREIDPIGHPTEEFEISFNKIVSNQDLIRSCRFYFVKGDLRDPTDELTTAIKNSHSPLVYFSNIFSYVPTLIEGNSEQDFVLFLNKLLSNNLNVNWYGDTPNRVCSTNIHKQIDQEYYWKININLPFNEFYQEILELEKQDFFVEHRAQDGHRGIYFNHGWHSFCIHGIGYNMTQGHEYYGYTDENAPYVWTKEALEHCPKMVQWFKNQKFKDRYHRIRIMKLSPGGIIGVHNDNSNPEAFATNMAVNNPLGCEMHFLNRDYQYLGTVPWTDGDIFKIQIGFNHYVTNNSSENRYHFIVHGDGGYL